MAQLTISMPLYLCSQAATKSPVSSSAWFQHVAPVLHPLGTTCALTTLRPVEAAAVAAAADLHHLQVTRNSNTFLQVISHSIHLQAHLQALQANLLKVKGKEYSLAPLLRSVPVHQHVQWQILAGHLALKG